MKKFKGFTLIELIVVIAIIGVLAAILVPAMMGWVRKASINSANANAKQIFTSAQTIAQEYETEGKDVVAKKGDTMVTGNASVTDDKTFVGAVNKNMSASGNAQWAVSVETDGYTIAAAIYSNNGKTYCGGYPNPAPTSASNDYATTLLDAAAGGKTAWKS